MKTRHPQHLGWGATWTLSWYQQKLHLLPLPSDVASIKQNESEMNSGADELVQHWRPTLIHPMQKGVRHIVPFCSMGCSCRASSETRTDKILQISLIPVSCHWSSTHQQLWRS
eukprot:scaffold5436_cov153-Pinguiococcus_pyrenoidosus.AAC.1